MIDFYPVELRGCISISDRLWMGHVDPLRCEYAVGPRVYCLSLFFRWDHFWMARELIEKETVLVLIINL